MIHFIMLLMLFSDLFFKVLEFGFCLDTTLKSFVENLFVSEDCNNIELKLEVIFSAFSIFRLVEYI